MNRLKRLIALTLIAALSVPQTTFALDDRYANDSEYARRLGVSRQDMLRAANQSERSRANKQSETFIFKTSITGSNLLKSKAQRDAELLAAELKKLKAFEEMAKKQQLTDKQKAEAEQAVKNIGGIKNEISKMNDRDKLIYTPSFIKTSQAQGIIGEGAYFVGLTQSIEAMAGKGSADVKSLLKQLEGLADPNIMLDFIEENPDAKAPKEMTKVLENMVKANDFLHTRGSEIGLIEVTKKEIGFTGYQKGFIQTKTEKTGVYLTGNTKIWDRLGIAFGEPFGDTKTAKVPIYKDGVPTDQMETSKEYRNLGLTYSEEPFTNHLFPDDAGGNVPFGKRTLFKKPHARPEVYNKFSIRDYPLGYDLYSSSDIFRWLSAYRPKDFPKEIAGDKNWNEYVIVLQPSTDVSQGVGRMFSELNGTVRYLTFPRGDVPTPQEKKNDLMLKTQSSMYDREAKEFVITLISAYTGNPDDPNLKAV